ncbi:MAG TPA: O-antigen ligase family protein [Candidatus Omnitrophota bacterium]|nr:O-antigen ligase family protein [Candidatus Omnitrophota bacterium]
MSAILVVLILIRPFISGIAYPYADFAFTAVSIIGLIIFLAVKQPSAERFRSVAYPLSLFIAGVCLSLIGSIDMATSVIELYKFLPCVLAFAAAACLDEKERRIVMFAAMCSAVVICAGAVYQRLFGFGHLNGYLESSRIASPVALHYLTEKRVFFPFITPNILAGYCALVLPLVFSQKRFYWIAVPLVIVLLLAQSLGAMIGLLAGIFLCMALFCSKPSAWSIALFTGVLALVTLIFWLRLSGESLETAAPGFMRLEYWRDTLGVIRSHAIFGTGIGNMRLQSSLYAHNAILQIWAETGIIGLAGFVWLCVAVLRDALRGYYANKKLLTALTACSCIVFLAHNMFDFTFSMPEASFLWWLLMGSLRAA